MGQSDRQAEWFRIVKMAMSVTQMGLSVAAPLVLCVLIAYWLQKQFALGGWVMIVGLILGLGGMAMSFYKIFRALTKEQKKKGADADDPEGRNHTGA